jgi:hypothetical protein
VMEDLLLRVPQQPVSWIISRTSLCNLCFPCGFDEVEVKKKMREDDVKSRKIDCNPNQYDLQLRPV